MNPKPWKIISSRPSRSFKIFSLRTDRALSPKTGKEYDFFILESSDWVNVIPITPEKDVVLIKQYRHGVREVTLEIPGGMVEGKDDPEEAAKRELLEETGYVGREMIPLGWVHPNPAILNNRCYSFLAMNVYPAGEQDQDEKEDISLLIEPLHKIPSLIKEGSITHSLVLAAFYRFYMEFREGFNV